jgi:hypothetical protein
VLTLAASIGIAELQASLAPVRDGVAASVKVTGTSLVADGTGAAAASVAVDRGHGDNLAGFELVGWRGGDHAEGSDEEGEGVHVEVMG